MERVFITGLGFVSSIGTGYDAVAENLRELQHGFVRRQLPGNGIGPELVCGSIEGFDLPGPEARDWTFPDSNTLDPTFLRALPPHGVYGYFALEEALEQAGVPRELLSSGDTGLFCASPGSARLLRHHLNRIETANWQRADPLGVVSSVAGTLNFNLSAHYGITGANCGFVSACTSSSHALGYAFDEIASGRQKRMLVVGAEDGDAESLIPFLGMRALSMNLDPDTASRPFDQARDGFVGTGGAAALVLESQRAANHRDAVPLAEMRGWAQASDGYSVAAPHPEGRGIRAAMERCLSCTETEASAIDWINAHATSTPAGDRAEAAALSSLPFQKAKISSTKGLTGHGLSYAGVLEAALCALCIHEEIVPGNAALTAPDPSCDDLNLPTRTEKTDLRLVLNNSSGFGGSNVCHLLAHPEIGTPSLP